MFVRYGNVLVVYYLVLFMNTDIYFSVDDGSLRYQIFHDILREDVSVSCNPGDSRSLRTIGRAVSGILEREGLSDKPYNAHNGRLLVFVSGGFEVVDGGCLDDRDMISLEAGISSGLVTKSLFRGSKRGSGSDFSDGIPIDRLGDYSPRKR